MYPYQLSPEGVYSFTTDFGITYYCRFIDCTNRISPLLGVYDVKIYEFDFYRSIPDGSPAGVKQTDKSIAETIIAICLSRFINEYVIIVGICDSSDGREKGRHQLFELWHKKFLQDFAILIPLQIEVEDVGNIYGNIFISRQFPYMSVLQQEIIDNSLGIISEKFNN